MSNQQSPHPIVPPPTIAPAHSASGSLPRMVQAQTPLKQDCLNCYNVTTIHLEGTSHARNPQL
jgi:hypothetical protein